MIQIEIISSDFRDALQKKVNDFLKEEYRLNDANGGRISKFSYIDLKYVQLETEGPHQKYSCVVIYRRA